MSKVTYSYHYDRDVPSSRVVKHASSEPLPLMHIACWDSSRLDVIFDRSVKQPMMSAKKVPDTVTNLPVHVGGTLPSNGYESRLPDWRFETRNGSSSDPLACVAQLGDLSQQACAIEGFLQMIEHCQTAWNIHLGLGLDRDEDIANPPLS